MLKNFKLDEISDEELALVKDEVVGKIFAEFKRRRESEEKIVYSLHTL